MGTLLVVGLLLMIAFKPNPRRPAVNKKKLHQERIATAHKILRGEEVPHLSGKPVTYESARLTGGVPYKPKEAFNGEVN